MDEIKILETEFDDKKRLVFWKVEQEGMPNYVMTFPSEDLGKAIGFNKDIPDEAMFKFMDMLVGKTVTVDKTVTIDKNTVDARKEDHEDDPFQEYPFKEILDKINEEDEKNEN